MVVDRPDWVPEGWEAANRGCTNGGCVLLSRFPGGGFLVWHSGETLWITTSAPLIVTSLLVAERGGAS